MKRVTGIGGIFFKSKDPAALKEWYRRHLDIEPGAGGAVAFEWREKDKPDEIGMTVWAPFREDTKYFEPSKASFMINYRVEDLAAVLAALRAEGVTVAEEPQDSEYGRFGWVMDPEGNRLELWQPPAGKKEGTE
jgi:predicted enzyme related to lactoylglutathione lyase